MDIKMDIKGFDKVKRRLDAMARRASALEGTHHVPASQMFTPAFMRQYTDFASFEDMIEATGHDVQSAADFERIPGDLWETLVKNRTRFTSWLEMQKKAGAEYFKGQLGL